MDSVRFYWIVLTLAVGFNYRSTRYTSADKTVSRSKNQRFDTILCDPGRVIEVTGVTQSTSTTDGTDDCEAGALNCTEKLPEQSSYYQEVKAACDGKLTCTNRTTGLHLKSQTGSFRTTIHYRCQNQTDEIRSLVKCMPHDFDILLCPVGSEIQLLDLYDVRSSTGNVGTCPATASVGDCVRRLEHKFNDFKKMCNGKLSCKGSDVVHSEVPCSEGIYFNESFLLVYKCAASDKAIKTISKCKGEYFDSAMCPSTASVRLLDVYSGILTGRGPGGCQSSLYDCVSRLSDIKTYNLYCENQTGCTGLLAGQENLLCDGSKIYINSNYTLLVYACEGADTDYSIAALPELSTTQSVSSGDSLTYSDISTILSSGRRKLDADPGREIGIVAGVVVLVILVAVVISVVCVRRRRSKRRPGDHDSNNVSSKRLSQNGGPEQRECTELADAGCDVSATDIYSEVTEIEPNTEGPNPLRNIALITNSDPQNIPKISDVYREVQKSDSTKAARDTTATSNNGNKVNPSCAGLDDIDDEGTLLVENKIYEESDCGGFETRPSGSPNGFHSAHSVTCGLPQNDDTELVDNEMYAMRN